MYEQTVRSMGHLFISYSRTDRGYAERLVTYLEAAGVDVWVDHGDIPPGSRYRRTIEAAIDACDALLVLMTPAARESTWVENELDWAERHRNRSSRYCWKARSGSASPPPTTKTSPT